MFELGPWSVAFQGNARPWAVWWLVFCIGISCFIPATAMVAIPAATAIVIAAAGLRTIDKSTAAKVEIAKVEKGNPPPT